MLSPGDRVAVFTGRDYSTVANHGIVLVPRKDSHSRTLVFLPHLNSYCLATSGSVLRFQSGNSDRVPFAEIVFEECTPQQCLGTCRRLGEHKNTFQFIRASDGRFGFDIRAEISDSGAGIGRFHLEVRIPANIEMESAGCINILRQILGLEFTRIIHRQMG